MWGICSEPAKAAPDREHIAKLLISSCKLIVSLTPLPLFISLLVSFSIITILKQDSQRLFSLFCSCIFKINMIKNESAVHPCDECGKSLFCIFPMDVPLLNFSISLRLMQQTLGKYKSQVLNWLSCPLPRASMLSEVLSSAVAGIKSLLFQWIFKRGNPEITKSLQVQNWIFPFPRPHQRKKKKIHAHV